MEQQQKELLTWEEMTIFQIIKKTPGPMLRNYGALNYRLMDKDFNPIRNFKRSDINSIVNKKWISIANDTRVTIL